MLTPSPAFTVVVASTGDRERLLASLASAALECVRDGVELIVTRADTPAGLVELTAAFPQARVIGAPPSTDLAELRSLGLAGARGDVVALLDDAPDHERDQGRWVSELRRRCSLERCRSTPATIAAEAGVTLSRPELSVVVPVHQGADCLASSLAALARSDLPRSRWELIVVDDASTDDTARIAARFADVVVRLLGKPHGTAYARNRGFEFARGDGVAFINADVCVQSDTLARFAGVLAHEPDVSAVFGAFDPCPGAAGLISQYRNLRLRYYHQGNAGVADTFCASCGAVRSAVFASVGMFDEWHFPRHGVEDFELGHRLRQHGHSIVMRPDIRAAHLKCWTLRGMIASDLHDRAVPWIRLFDRRTVTLTRQKDRLRAGKRINTALTWLALALTLGGLRADQPWLLFVAGLCMAVVLRHLVPQHRFFAQHGGHGLALAAVPLELLSYLVGGVAVVFGSLLREFLGEPKPHPTVEAFAEIGVRTWPPVPVQRVEDPPRQPPATLSQSA